MKRVLLFAGLLFAFACSAQEVDLERLEQALEPWEKYEKQKYPRYSTEEYRAIADNMLAYQNEDGGWPKNLDMRSKASPAEVLQALEKPRHRLSTLDNANVYTQVEFLALVHEMTREERYRKGAERGIEYMLSTQHANGSWRGWDADAVTFNDGIIYGVMSTWLEIIYEKSPYGWIDPALRARIETSWERGLAVILATQYCQQGVKTAWAQQYDHTTLQPTKARSYELPGLVASESSDIVMLLMRIRKPSPEVIEAVKCAVAWLEKVKIEGKQIKLVSVPEGLPENRKIKKDRVLVDDPDAEPIWARYYELEGNRPFFCTREGVKVYTMQEVPAERRAGYAWYGEWGNKVLKKFPQWLEKQEKQQK